MKVLVQGSKEFDDYSVFMRAMSVALSSLNGGDTIFEVYSVGPKRTNNLVLEFMNVSEDGMVDRGLDARKYFVPFSWAENNMDKIDYFIYLSNPTERGSRLLALAEHHNTESAHFNYGY